MEIALLWCLDHEEQILGGGDAAVRHRMDCQDEETMEEEQEAGPVAFVSEATMTAATQQLVEALKHRDR